MHLTIVNFKGLSATQRCVGGSLSLVNRWTPSCLSLFFLVYACQNEIRVNSSLFQMNQRYLSTSKKVCLKIANQTLLVPIKCLSSGVSYLCLCRASPPFADPLTCSSLETVSFTKNVISLLSTPFDRYQNVASPSEPSTSWFCTPDGVVNQLHAQAFPRQ